MAKSVDPDQLASSLSVKRGHVMFGKRRVKINFFKKKSFRNTIRASNSLDPDQARHFVGPDLGPNCLQRLSAETKVATSGKRVTQPK